MINQFLEPRQEIKQENLVPYQNKNNIYKYQSKENTFFYKLKDQEMFFVIQHVSNTNHSIFYKMLNNCLAIMQEWGRQKKEGKNIKYPIIVPIFIDTRNQMSKIDKNIPKKEFNLEYNLIDIKQISKQDFLKKESQFGYIMFLKKIEKEESNQNLNLIIKELKIEEKLKKLQIPKKFKNS